MSFQETEVVRDKGGKFAEKAGTAPEATLSDTVAVPTCDRCGGPWGGDTTCETCCDDNGDPRPVPLELAPDPDYSAYDEVQPSDIQEAEERLAIDIVNQLWPEVKSVHTERVRDELTAQHDRVQRHAKTIARNRGPERAFEAGDPHPLDSHLDAIWEGKSAGFSEDNLRSMLDSTRELRTALAEGRARPRDVIGTGYRGDTRKLANTYLDSNERSLERALATRGRANALNVSNARSFARREKLPRA